MATVIDGVLSEATLRAASGDRAFDQGQDLVHDVRGLRLDPGRAVASVRAERVHTAAVEWPSGALTGSCSCRGAEPDSWCSHVVAVGLAALDSVTVSTLDPSMPPIERYLASLDAVELIDLVLEMASTGSAAARLLESRAALATGDLSSLAEELMDAVRQATSARGFIHYRRTFEIGTEIQEVLDELEKLIERGGADAARPALLKALTATRRMTLQADDSGGVIADACQRAAHLYARSCVRGQPDEVKLGRWLLKFRKDSPGWPDTPLDMFAPAMGEKGLEVYRKGVADLDAEQAGLAHVQRFDVNRMLLELADHDGDVDAAIAVLTRDPEKLAYGDVIDRLLASGRKEDAVAWTDRAVAAERLGTIGGYGRRNGYWLDPGEVAGRYLAHGRRDDALAVLRTAFARQPSAAAYDVLGRFADGLGLGSVERAWALDEARRAAQRPHANGAPLVEISLRDGDLDAAWAAADEFGPGDAWWKLAEASRDSLPMRAVELHLRSLRPKLERANPRIYAEIATQLVELRAFYDAGGALDAFDALLRDLRETYRRRPTFLAALDKARLPGRG
ncbi:putative Zn finger protein [Humibacillus xanthopallidus]|uniref:Putative Zn finger protein n=1 Tax=Humibacillus xanthopallidus TaxID=412689 RepID=A0A543PWE1_9MICO|nr:DUF6880 family protein [Humibacillus xanthopallidus]TQN48350.1 putative Zn finger protein [Humibacillus xanthopallidus]